MPPIGKTMEPASEADYQSMESQAATLAAAPPASNKCVTSLLKWSSINMVDSCLAAAGLIFAGVVLHSIDLAMGPNDMIPMFNGAMLTMAIVFFANPAPPPYKVFLQCTIGAWLIGMLLKWMALESITVTIIVAVYARASMIARPLLVTVRCCSRLTCSQQTSLLYPTLPITH